MRYEQHGKYGSPEYKSWENMRTRCLNSKSTRFKDYGGRGIKICLRWLNSFEDFYKDMGPRPSSKHSLDRINNDGNYSPSNCRWSTNEQQYRNRRSNKVLKYKGKKKTLIEWTEILGLNYKTIHLRLSKGCSVEEAFEKPLRITKRTSREDIKRERARAKLREWGL